MNTLLLLLVIFGLGAIIISIHVFAESARTYDVDSGPDAHSIAEFHERSPLTRRSDTSADFPLSIDGIVIPVDRRSLADRRKLAA